MSHRCGSCTSLCQDGRNQREARGCEKPGERGGVGAVLAFGDYATHPLVAALITWKPCHRTLSAGREYPPLSQKRGPPVELALVVLVVATFAALVVPSLVGVFLDPGGFKDRPTPPSLAPRKERNRFGLPNWLLMPHLRKDRSSQIQHQPSPYGRERSAPSLPVARPQTPESFGDPRPSADKPVVVAPLPVRRK
jgi:hypothetical protein